MQLNIFCSDARPIQNANINASHKVKRKTWREKVIYQLQSYATKRVKIRFERCKNEYWKYLRWYNNSR